MDLWNATYNANKIVRSYGMGNFIRDTDCCIFEKTLSEDMKNKLDKEINDLLHDSYTRVKNMLESHRNQLDLLASTLLERKTLYGEEVKALIQSIESSNDHEI